MKPEDPKYKREGDNKNYVAIAMNKRHSTNGRMRHRNDRRPKDKRAKEQLYDWQWEKDR